MNKGSIRRRNAREPLLRITGNPVLDYLLVMETSADGEGSKKGERSQGCVSNDNPAGGERDGRKLATCVVRHIQEGREQESDSPTPTGICDHETSRYPTGSVQRLSPPGPSGSMVPPVSTVLWCTSTHSRLPHETCKSITFLIADLHRNRKIILRDVPTPSIAVADVSERAVDIPPPKPPAGTTMEQTSLWVLKALLPSPNPYAKHTLLTTTALGHTPGNVTNSEFVHSAVGCTFLPSQFTPSTREEVYCMGWMSGMVSLVRVS